MSDSIKRGVLAHVLAAMLDVPGYGDYVRRADVLTDGAMDALEYEEPELYAWLAEDEEMGTIFHAHVAAIQVLFDQARARGIPTQALQPQLTTVLGRAILALSWYATMRTRPSVQEVYSGPEPDGG